MNRYFLRCQCRKYLLPYRGMRWENGNFQSCIRRLHHIWGNRRYQVYMYHTCTCMTLCMHSKIIQYSTRTLCMCTIMYVFRSIILETSLTNNGTILLTYRPVVTVGSSWSRVNLKQANLNKHDFRGTYMYAVIELYFLAVRFRNQSVHAEARRWLAGKYDRWPTSFRLHSNRQQVQLDTPWS